MTTWLTCSIFAGSIWLSTLVIMPDSITNILLPHGLQIYFAKSVDKCKTILYTLLIGFQKDRFNPLK